LVSRGVEERTGFGLGPVSRAAEIGIPEEVSLADGLSQEEAVALALWNNPEFQVALAQLGFARADLIEAGLLRNPVLSLLFPTGPKQLEATLKLPVEALWQRPRRVAAAKLSAGAVAERLVQHGLGLIAEVKVAYADLVLARERARLAEEAARIGRRIAEITEARLRAGDVSELEASAVRADGSRAEEESARLAQEAVVAYDRLRSLLGLGLSATQFELAPGPPTAVGSPAAIDSTGCSDLDGLLKEALAARPDLRAAELAVEAAGKRVGWERSKVLTLIGILDANENEAGLESGPGVEMEAPLFDRNQAGLARARAELERASRDYVATRHRIALEVREANTGYARARQALKAWRGTIRPSLEEEVQRTEQAHAVGEVSILFVLVTTRRLTEARVREAEAEADVLRAAARLDQSVGRTCPGVP
jgi:cobalt-zinc-cadmium efflux system outer membrane protein